MNRPIPPAAFDLLKRFEGLRLQSYLDPAGLWTIGYGRRAHIEPHMEISEGIADIFLHDDAAAVGAAIERLLRSAASALSSNQFAALVSFVFNIGAGAFATSHVAEYILTNNIRVVAYEFLRWVHDRHGNPLAGLQLRRQAEAKLFSTPDSPTTEG